MELDKKSFETKVASLIATTRHLDVAQIMMLRRMTLSDPASRKWASEKQLNVVFNVILSKALERLGPERLRVARNAGFADLLPAGSSSEESQILFDLALPVIGPQTAAPAPDTAVTAADTAPARPLDFNSLFDDTLCNHLADILATIRIGPSSKTARPLFIVAPAFTPCLQKVVRQYILPQMRTSRSIQTLGTKYNWSETGGQPLLEVLYAGEHNNPILHNWDNCWQALNPSAKAKTPAKRLLPWPTFREDAERHNYIAPTEHDVGVMLQLIRFDTDGIARGWREISQLYEQEFAPSTRQDCARDGALRDGIIKWWSKLPNHVGEFLAIRAFFDFDRIEPIFMRRLLNNFGKTDADRKRHAPFLFDFVQQFGD